jgi:hypothetical protein
LRISIKLFVVDEIGMGGPRILKVIDNRLRELMGVDESFGGVSVLVCGDFYQLEAVKQTQIYDAAFKLDELSPLDLDGFNIFISAPKYELSDQMRCSDPVYQQILDNFRNGITTGLKQYVIDHILTTENKEGFGPPTLVVSPGNQERYHMQYSMLKNWTLTLNNCNKIISWRLNTKLCGHEESFQQTLENLQLLPEDFEAEILRLNPQLLCHFYPGAPGVLLDNLNTLLGLANGTKIHLYSLEWDNDLKRSEAIQYINNQESNSVYLPPHLAPSTVMVKPCFSNAMTANFP